MAKKPERRQVSYKLPEALLEQLDKLAETSRRSLTTEVEIAIEKHLAESGLWPPPKKKQS